MRLPVRRTYEKSSLGARTPIIPAARAIVERFQDRGAVRKKTLSGAGIWPGHHSSRRPWLYRRCPVLLIGLPCCQELRLGFEPILEISTRNSPAPLIKFARASCDFVMGGLRAVISDSLCHIVEGFKMSATCSGNSCRSRKQSRAIQRAIPYSAGRTRKREPY
jgi:hypothetical protein